MEASLAGEQVRAASAQWSPREGGGAVSLPLSPEVGGEDRPRTSPFSGAASCGSAGKPLTWCQERVEGLGRRGWPGHQGVQVHQGRVGAQEGLWGFPGAAGLARGHSQGLRLKGVRACSSTFLGWQRGHRLSYKTTTDTGVVSRREVLRLLHPRCSRPGRPEPRRHARTHNSPWGCGGGMLIAGLSPTALSWRQPQGR